MPQEVSKIVINLNKEKAVLKDDIFFHYTHGLKSHYGNCQRLLHGHRSTIEIFLNNSRDRALEFEFVKKLFKKSVHFVYWENVKNKKELELLLKDHLPEGEFSLTEDIVISYTSEQGEFELTIPLSDVYILQTESTVELLAEHFVKIIQKKVGSGIPISVAAFEGIGKGAKSSGSFA